MAGAEYEEGGDGGVEGPVLMVGILVCLGLAIPWYLSSSEAVHHVRTALILLPLLLLIALKLLSTSDGVEHAETATAGVWSILSSALEPSSPVHDEVGGSPLKVAIFLAIIFFMIWYQSGFQQYWHPIVRS